MTRLGKVFLVGAGPGDPGLITARGIECLRQADAVLYDYLVNSQTLLHAGKAAELTCLGRHGRSTIWSQTAINEQLVTLARQGKTVVRLKGGDPIIFGRAADEFDALVQNGIPFEVVPGVTAALAAGSYAGIPVTHRDHASAVAMVTGQENPGKGDSTLDFEALARFPGTLVVYMGVTTANVWTKKLQQHGMPSETPVAVIRRCSWPDQQVLRCRLDELADRVTPYSKFPPPAIAIIGSVTTLSDSLSWFQRRPLFGQRIVVTRPLDQCESLAKPLRELGADVLVQPAIDIRDPADWSAVDDALNRLGEFDYVVFSSSNGVDRFIRRLLSKGADLRALGNVRLAAVGPGTARRLRKYHLGCDLLPDQEYRAEALAEALMPVANGRHFLLIRASRGREVLAEQLRHAGARIEQIVVYESVDVPDVHADTRTALSDGHVDWITVTSSAIARSLISLLADDLHKARLVSISPVTTETLRRDGFEPAAEATEYTMDGIVQAILKDS